jgi:hypothetical protein
MKRFFSSAAASAVLTLSLGVGTADALPIILSTSAGVGAFDDTSGGVTFTGITLGSSITFEYMFETVTYTGGAWPALNVSVINPLLESGGNVNFYHNAVTGWLSATVDTSSSIGTIHDLAVTANTFGVQGNLVWVSIRNLAINGPVSVPEPSTLLMLGLGLAGAGLALRKSRTVA